MSTLFLVGSTAASSTSERLGRRIEHAVRRRSPEVESAFLDRRLLRMPVLDADAFAGGVLDGDPDVCELRSRIAGAEAIVVITPVQHGSYSGALKNLLDHAPRGAFRGKPVLIGATAGSLHPGAAACEHLRAVARSLGGWTVPTQLIAERSELLGEPPAHLDRRIDRAAAELLLATRMLSPAVL